MPAGSTRNTALKKIILNLCTQTQIPAHGPCILVEEMAINMVSKEKNTAGKGELVKGCVRAHRCVVLGEVAREAAGKVTLKSRPEGRLWREP